MKTIILGLILFTLTVFSHAQNLDKEVLISAPKDGEAPYFYIPFDVPADTKSLSVSYEYDNLGGKNTLDLGVFDSGFKNGELSGFRGWSGGRRSTIFISERSASNGYISGPLPEGRWQVILGLYRVVPDGVRVRLKVSINEIDSAASDLARQEGEKKIFVPPQKSAEKLKTLGYNWFRGDLHTHTFHSDGNWTVDGLARFGNAIGLDFIGITDHNTRSHHGDIETASRLFPKLLLLRGEEVTTYGGHLNVWGLKNGDMIDFRAAPKDPKTLAPIVASVRGKRLLASINHPTAICGGCSWTYGDDWSRMDSVEVWNGTWDALDESALQKWDKLLQQGKRLTAIGSSDSHVPPSGLDDKQNTGIGVPVDFVGAKELNQRSILDAIKEGRVSVGESTDSFLALSSGRLTSGDVMTIAAGKESSLRISSRNFPKGTRFIIIQNGSVIKEIEKKDGERILDLRSNALVSGYIRVEARNNNRMLAFTNPIYIETTK